MGNAFRISMVPFWVVGHRGSPCEEAENTLPSFERALERDGANALEMDICVTRDGDLLVWHDFDPAAVEARLRQMNLEPQTRYPPRPFDRAVCELTVPEARSKLGYVGVEAHIPTLGEVLDWSRAHPSLGLVFLDLKLSANRTDLVAPFLARLERLVSESPPRFTFVIECAEIEIAAELRRQGAPHPVALDVYKTSSLDAVWRLGVEWVCAQKPRPGQALLPFWRQKRILDRLKDVLRCAFTINEADEMNALLDRGVMAIQTDRPARLRELADRRGLLVAA